MGILDTIKNKAESTISKSSTDEDLENTEQISKNLKADEEKLIKKANAALSKALQPVTELGADAIQAFLKTDEGKKVMMHFGKHFLQKYWWAAAGIVTFNIIGIFATMKFAIQRAK